MVIEIRLSVVRYCHVWSCVGQELSCVVRHCLEENLRIPYVSPPTITISDYT